MGVVAIVAAGNRDGAPRTSYDRNLTGYCSCLYDRSITPPPPVLSVSLPPWIVTVSINVTVCEHLFYLLANVCVCLLSLYLCVCLSLLSLSLSLSLNLSISVSLCLCVSFSASSLHVVPSVYLCLFMSRWLNVCVFQSVIISASPCVGIAISLYPRAPPPLSAHCCLSQGCMDPGGGGKKWKEEGKQKQSTFSGYRCRS